MGGIIVTDTGYRNTTLPRLKAEGKDVFPGSPLAVIGLWVFAVRARFEPSDGYPLPWVYDPLYRPEDDVDGNPPPEGVPQKLMIESSYNVEKAARNYRPSIFVGRGGSPIRAEKIMVDNKVGVEVPTDLKAYHCMASMPLSIDCFSDNAGESSAIAESVWAYVLTTRDIFRQDFGFHEITEPTLGDTAPHKVDKEAWVTSVQFSVTYDQRWSVTPIAPKLRDMALILRNRDSETDYFVELAVKSGIEE